jgi:hypothetical protein
MTACLQSIGAHRDRGSVKTDSEARAREIFVAFDGSKFGMWHEGLDEEYRTYAVPAELEKKWLSELLAQKLDALDQPGNFWTIHFLI